MSSNHYIQQYTADQIPFYVHMRTGVTSWTLPAHAGPDAVKYITHLTEQGVPYYEDVHAGSTSWTLPLEKLSTAARRSSMAIKKMDRRETDAYMAEEEKNNKANNLNSPVNSNKSTSRGKAGTGAGMGILEEGEGEESDASGGSAEGRSRSRSRGETVTRAPFSTSGPQGQGGSESDYNTGEAWAGQGRAGKRDRRREECLFVVQYRQCRAVLPVVQLLGLQSKAIRVVMVLHCTGGKLNL